MKNLAQTNLRFFPLSFRTPCINWQNSFMVQARKNIPVQARKNIPPIL
jgi:hypothetical protein